MKRLVEVMTPKITFKFRVCDPIIVRWQLKIHISAIKMRRFSGLWNNE